MESAMEIVVGLLIAAMIVFAVGSALREVRLYRISLKGDIQYLVSKRRRNRRLLISTVLLSEAILLFLGIFILEFPNPVAGLLYWLPPFGLIVWMVFLGMRDFQETSKDVDVIFREASDVILKKVRQKEDV